MAASFPDLEHGATGDSVISVDPTWGSKIVSLKSDQASFDHVGPPAVISGVPTCGSRNAPVRKDGSVVSQNAAYGNGAVERNESNIGDAHISMPPVSNVSNLSLDDRVSRFMDVMNNVVSETLTTIYRPPVQSTPIYTTSNPYSYAYVNTNDVAASTHRS